MLDWTGTTWQIDDAGATAKGSSLASDLANSEKGGQKRFQWLPFVNSILRSNAALPKEIAALNIPPSSCESARNFPGGGYESYHFIRASGVLPDRVSDAVVAGRQT
jgi:hypothetical protein